MAKAKGSRKGPRSTKVSSKKSKSKALSVIDSVTGATVRSDVVYGPDSILSQNFVAQGDSTLEFEFSKNRIIVNQIDTFTRETPNSTSGAPTATTTKVYRWVIDGNFEYSKDGGLNGVIERNTIGEVNPGLYPDGGIYETINLRVGTRGMSPGVPIYSLIFPATTATTYQYANQLPPYSSGTAIDTDKNRLGELGLASFYPDGWWTDPFSSNLI